MADYKIAFSGFGNDLFAGIPVSYYKTTLDWYVRLTGCPPSFQPNDVEAVWQITEYQWIYIIVDPKHAGHSVQNIMDVDLSSLIDQVCERGINYSKEELPADNTRKVMYYDPDGNEIGFISSSSN